MAIRLKEKKKIGLVLSGGGIKAAAFHVGVCLALKEKGFHFAGGSRDHVRKNFPDDLPMTIRLYAGSSAGSFVAAILSAGYTLEALSNAFDIGAGVKPHYPNHSFRHLKPISYRDIFANNGRGILSSIPLSLFRKSMTHGGFEAMLKERFRINGLFTTKKIEKYLRSYALSHNEFDQLGVELYIMATELNHSRKVIFGPYLDDQSNERIRRSHLATISQAVAASTSLPPVFSPYPIKDTHGNELWLYDGEIRETLSTHVASDHGCDLIISSCSMQPYHYTEEVGSLHKYGIPMIINQALYQVVQQKVDRHIQWRQDIRSIYNAIDGYFKQSNLPEEHRQKILDIISSRVNYRSNVDYLYIMPKPENHEMFFADHFSLSPKILEKIVKIGFRTAIAHLRQIDL